MSKKIEFSYVRENIELEGYKVLSTDEYYYNNKSKFDVICTKGHECKTSWNRWQSGYRCKICTRRRISDSQKMDFNKIKESFESERYQLLTTEYINNKQKLESICPEGHEYSLSWTQWNTSGNRCPVCYHKRLGEEQKLSYEYVKDCFEKRGYTLLSKEYNGALENLFYICPKGHIGKIRWHNFQHGYGCNSCPKVRSNISKAENEIFDFIKEYFPDAEHSNRLLIPPYEIDIVIPSLFIGIEYCGILWHSELFGGKGRNYHLNKLNLCKSKGYTLITIFEDEWLHKKEIVKSRLKSILNISGSDIVYARNCEIREIKANIANEFLNNNHLQGSGSSNIRIGAFYNDNLVSTMTFCRPNISHGGNPSDDSYELNRFCSLINTQVVGIASRLLKYFINQYNPKLIFSYADKRWSTGNLYYKLGFKHIHDSQPNYWYVVSDRRVHRFNFRKSQLKKMDNYNLLLSEWEIMKNNDHDRIWDCGNIKFVLDEENI
uniref:Putative Hef-like homing endonuclease n=1 Tax=viral metagenome TaxID=1070528 RepID=A0A6M3XHQ5_9ZZZZ